MHLNERNSSVDDEDATYAISVRAMQLWPYRGGLLVGEDVSIDWDVR